MVVVYATANVCLGIHFAPVMKIQKFTLEMCYNNITHLTPYTRTDRCEIFDSLDVFRRIPKRKNVFYFIYIRIISRRFKRVRHLRIIRDRANYFIIIITIARPNADRTGIS